MSQAASSMWMTLAESSFTRSPNRLYSALPLMQVHKDAMHCLDSSPILCSICQSRVRCQSIACARTHARHPSRPEGQIVASALPGINLTSATVSEALADDGARHVLGISGGKDSAALALYLRDRVPQ